MDTADTATIRSLRLDVAYQIARRAEQLGTSQRARARALGIPQPTLSKIVNGRVSDLSLELLIRIAVRAELPLTLQTGNVPAEAGAYVASSASPGFRIYTSPSSEASRNTLSASGRRLTPEQRLDAFLEHSQLLSQVHAAGQGTKSEHARTARASAK